jgi:hypothetical protein
VRPGHGARRLLLTAHVVASVGWLGAVAAFLGLAVTGLVSERPETVRAAYVAMEPLAAFVLVPLALASLATGIVQSLVTAWGLLRHYWVVFKLLINVVATLFLLLYLRTLASLADRAAAGDELALPRSLSPLLHAAGAVALLLVATTLAVYKPRGLTPYGWRKRLEERRAEQP